MGSGRTARIVKAVFPRRFPGLRTAAFIVGGVLVWLALNLGTIRDYLYSSKQRDLKRDSVAALQQKLIDLRRDKEDLEFGAREGEKTAREDFGLVKPGETLIIVKSEDEPASLSAPLENGQKNP